MGLEYSLIGTFVGISECCTKMTQYTPKIQDPKMVLVPPPAQTSKHNQLIPQWLLVILCLSIFPLIYLLGRTIVQLL